MRYDFEFNEFNENYPVEVENKLRHRFIELCNTILYSDDQQLVNRCYDILFKDYRGYILAGHPLIKCSQFEEVILKILDDEENNTLYTERGITTTPFMRYLALIKEADISSMHMSNMSYKSKLQNSKFKDTSKINLKSYLFMFVAGHNDKIKNNLIRRLIHQYFSDMWTV